MQDSSDVSERLRCGGVREQRLLVRACGVRCSSAHAELMRGRETDQGVGKVGGQRIFSPLKHHRFDSFCSLLGSHEMVAALFSTRLIPRMWLSDTLHV